MDFLSVFRCLFQEYQDSLAELQDLEFRFQPERFFQNEARFLTLEEFLQVESLRTKCQGIAFLLDETIEFVPGFPQWVDQFPAIPCMPAPAPETLSGEEEENVTTVSYEYKECRDEGVFNSDIFFSRPDMVTKFKSLFRRTRLFEGLKDSLEDFLASSIARKCYCNYGLNPSLVYWVLVSLQVQDSYSLVMFTDFLKFLDIPNTCSWYFLWSIWVSHFIPCLSSSQDEREILLFSSAPLFLEAKKQENEE